MSNSSCMCADVGTLSYLTTFASRFLSTHTTYKTKLTQQLNPVLHIAEVVFSLTMKTSLIQQDSATAQNPMHSLESIFYNIIINRGLWTSGLPDVSLCNFFANEAS